MFALGGANGLYGDMVWCLRLGVPPLPGLGLSV